ncbi:expressed protein [Echinococcus multilocularis]|uniref:Expressed protein n=1 Tax=Echinococcus multilocularis TaxID=6211 RepID=A0A068XW70_ECHMU|nr:expressed protein [Echinococcus multilocularis]
MNKLSRCYCRNFCYFLIINGPGDGFYKTSNSGGLLLREQIVLYWNVPVAYNCRAARQTHRAFSQVVCAGVSVRPAGR